MSYFTPSQIELMKMMNPSFDNSKKCTICGKGLFDSGTPPLKCEKCGQTDYCVGCSWGIRINGIYHQYCSKHPMMF